MNKYTKAYSPDSRTYQAEQQLLYRSLVRN